jgi:hypothetical protein
MMINLSQLNNPDLLKVNMKRRYLLRGISHIVPDALLILLLFIVTGGFSKLSPPGILQQQMLLVVP